ncbi:MAG: hypothetical protein ACE149_08245 [Armatimonadota bacterium]
MDIGDRSIIRELATRVAEIAACPIQEEKRKLCYAINALKPIRATVFCHPVCAWDVLVPESALQCEDKRARKIEYALRMRVYAAERFSDDEVEDGAYDVPRVIRSCGWGIAPEYIRPQEARGSYVWDPPIKSRRDLDLIKVPTVEYDEEATQRELEFHQELFGDILQVRLHGGCRSYAGLIDEWAALRGINQTFLDMAEDPEMVHEGMRRLMEGRIAELESAESQGLLSLNNAASSVGSGGSGLTHDLPAPDFDGHVRLRDLWVFADSQTMAPVSPAMHEEFVLRYQVPILRRFGLTYYGCCEPLHQKLPLLKRLVPNLRKVSISRWADKRISAQELGGNYVFECKSDPMVFASDVFDEDRIRESIRSTLALGKEHGCVMELILDTADNIRGDPCRVDRWTQIAREEAEEAAA